MKLVGNSYCQFLLAILVSSVAVHVATGAEKAPSFVVASKASELLESHCFSCHDTDSKKGDIRLDTLAGLPLNNRLDLLNKMQEQLYTKEMPPRKKKTQPSEAQRENLLNWISGELRKHKASTLEEKLRYPGYGNYVDHEKLFSGTVKAKAFSPARRWLVSPQIFHQRVMDVFRLEGRERAGFAKRQFHGVTNPFMLPEHSGVRDFDVTTLDGGHLLVMLSNAKWIAGKQIFAAQLKTPKKAALMAALNNRDRWYPKGTTPAFEAIVLKDGPLTEAEMVAAVQVQFDCVLRREATAEEVAKYVELMRSTIALANNTEGLKQMLTTVLLESEFLYRLEFGGGELDEHGRRKLTPREAAMAISHALGDRRPDAKLTEAAAQGRLETKADYVREVQRLLADENYFRGEIDSTLNGKHYRSNVTSHPKIIRFFREFFGYAGSLKVFKDGKRSDGKYSNPGRGSQATPGWLTYEADQIVTWHVEKDRNVFESLLTSDRFFVYNNMDAEAGRKLIDEWRSVYEKLKDTDWRTNAEQVLADNLEFLKQHPLMRIKDSSRPGELVNYMHFFEESFGQGREPFTRIPWSHGYTYHHSPFYSLPPTPSIGRYGSWKSSKFMKVEKQQFWNYPVEQPFSIAQRKGILTHPAWLIAHSTNFHSDPIRRGRWIREKLLAGRVPDVPITVDAQVPEDPHRTFRARVEKVTAAAECVKCHQHMNPLGLAFEMFDDFGRFRTEEKLEHPENLLKTGNGKSTFDVYKTAPVITTGGLDGTGEAKLDGPVKDALELIDRVARSDRARQSIIRHAFRFYMGRNELLSDSPTLIAADRAYLESGGSFRAVIVSLLTSDSFRYRKSNKEQP